MALDFDGSTDYLTASAPVNVEPLSMACWYHSKGSGTTFRPLMGVRVNDGTDRQIRLVIGDSSGWKIQANSWSLSGYHTGVATAASSHDTWQHAAGVWATNSSRSAYLNGGSKGTDTNANAQSSGVANQLNIGVSIFTGTDDFFLGYGADYAIWNAALTDAEVLSLSKGYSPLLVRPQSLVFYLPGVRNKQDVRKGITLTEAGTVGVIAHPRIIYPYGDPTGITRPTLEQIQHVNSTKNK